MNAFISAAWREAGTRLGIRVKAPGRVPLADGRVLDVEAYLPDFGSSSGVLVVALEDEARYALADTTGRYVSRVARAYATFDLALFTSTLDDWGWFGADTERPSWFTGKGW